MDSRRVYILVIVAIALAAAVNLISGALELGRTGTYLIAIPFLVALVAIGVPWSHHHLRPRPPAQDPTPAHHSRV
jgi:hypothetical protein